MKLPVGHKVEVASGFQRQEKQNNLNRLKIKLILTFSPEIIFEGETIIEWGLERSILILIFPGDLLLACLERPVHY